jgi:hypothetical protein
MVFWRVLRMDDSLAVVSDVERVVPLVVEMVARWAVW